MKLFDLNCAFKAAMCTIIIGVLIILTVFAFKFIMMIVFIAILVVAFYVTYRSFADE